ncbi:MAG: hypothetical protein KVP17_000896 [Porospora cf. gigantea B]|uniref:uncharacterized protein n=1 Tax=Porospora cf. gigantea B TaxID=2853592 RepID=UPI003571A1C2|nr:MAG: hypothetical protein KVP17_000896 [Porospora cf. gigantea B]
MPVPITTTPAAIDPVCLLKDVRFATDMRQVKVASVEECVKLCHDARFEGCQGLYFDTIKRSCHLTADVGERAARPAALAVELRCAYPDDDVVTPPPASSSTTTSATGGGGGGPMLVGGLAAAAGGFAVIGGAGAYFFSPGAAAAPDVVDTTAFEGAEGTRDVEQAVEISKSFFS